MNNVIELLKGKKQYFVAAFVGACAAAEALGYPIPDYVYGIAAAFGIAANRAAITKSAV